MKGYGIEKLVEDRTKTIYEKYIKRILDIILSFLALIISSPVMIIVAILVKRDLGSPVIFKQNRPGRNEKIFCMYKFRSMTDNCDNVNGRLLLDAERLTPFGQKLRSTSLDEIPELWNIFKGDMSFIGPRPLLEKYLPYYSEDERRRHDVRPGLTGLAQVNGRNNLSWDERLELDRKYVQRISFFLDVKIVITTIKKVFEHADIVTNGIYKMQDLDEERRNRV